MKRIFALLLAILMLGSLAACAGDNGMDETVPDTQADTVVETPGDTLENEGETTEDVLDVVVEKGLPKGRMPRKVYYSTLAQNGMSHSERYLLASLQGLSSKYSDEHILQENGQYSRFFNKYIEDMIGAPISETIDGEEITLENLLNHYLPMGFIKGYILWTEDNIASLQVGVSLAGLMDALLVTEEYQQMLDDNGLECLFDVRECDDAWLRQSEYWDQLRRDISFAQPYHLPDLADYAIMCGGVYYTMYEDNNAEGHTQTYEFLDDNAIVFGYCGGLGEWGTVYSFSCLNACLVPSNFVMNLSTLSSFVLENPKQKRPAPTDAENVHTVTFVYSDGDNISCTTINNFTDSIYLSPYRGQFAMGWGMPATGIDLIAPVYSYYYDTMTENDEFVMALSGVGYTHPAAWSAEARAKMTEDLADYMRRSDIRYMVILDESPNSWDEEVFADFTEHDGIEGIFYVGPFNQKGNVVWTNGKPTVGSRLSFVDGYNGTYNEILRFLQRPGLSTNVTKARSYSMYYVGYWCTGMNIVASLVEQLPDNVDVVTPGVFMDRLTRNCAPADADAE